MKKRLARLAQRRLELLGNIEAQRMVLAETSVQLHKPLAVVDVGLHAVRLIYNHPALFAGAVTVLLTWRRKGIVGLAKNGWRLLYLYPSAIFFGLKYISAALHSPSEDTHTEVL
jgi:YqjK-like protein